MTYKEIVTQSSTKIRVVGFIWFNRKGVTIQATYILGRVILFIKFLHKGEVEKVKFTQNIVQKSEGF